MKYCLTSYYIYEPINEQQSIIWSTLNSKGYILEKDNKRKFEKILDRADCIMEYINEKWFMELYEIGIFILQDNKPLEGKIIDDMHYTSVYSQSFMSITLIPTDACNLKCIYCYENEQIHFMNESVKLSILKMIEKDRFLKTLHISWFGGEPLVNKQLVIDFMSELNVICKNKGIVLISDMTTNATLLDLDTFKRLLKLKVINYQITIDGCKETHDIQRPMSDGCSSYDKIIHNLCDIRDHVKSYAFKIGIRTNFTDFVHSKMGQFVETLDHEFKHDKRFYFFFQWVKNWGGDRINKMAKECLPDSEAIDKYGIWMDETSKVGVTTGHISQIRANSALCVAAHKKSFIINYDGTLHKCTTGMYDEKYKDLNKIGYIDKEGNVIIDAYKQVKWITRESNFTECYDCNLYPICQGIPCPLSTIKNSKRTCTNNDKFVRIILRGLAMQGQVMLLQEME